MQTDPASDNQKSESDRLQNLRQLISGFDLVKCLMHHEKIKRESDGLYPVLNAAVDHGFQRVPFCTAEVRGKRLACAHTGARNRLTRALEGLSETVFSPDQVAQWKDRISQLEFKIVHLDWKKGDMEKEHARQSKEFCDGGGQVSEAEEAFREIDGTIRDLVDKHCVCVDRLSELLDEIQNVLPGSGAGE